MRDRRRASDFCCFVRYHISSCARLVCGDGLVVNLISADSTWLTVAVRDLIVIENSADEQTCESDKRVIRCEAECLRIVCYFL